MIVKEDKYLTRMNLGEKALDRCLQESAVLNLFRCDHQSADHAVQEIMQVNNKPGHKNRRQVIADRR